MTPGGSTEELLTRLTTDLEPVRPVAPLRRQVLAVAAIWAVSVAIVAVWLGLRPLAVLERGRLSTTLAWALAWVGLAGLTLGLAIRIPGRERLALAAAGGVALGFLGIGALVLLLPGSLADAGSVSECLRCSGHSLLFAIPPGLVAMLLALRGGGWHAYSAGLGLALGATSLGALLVHMGCASPSPWHWLIAHALVPLAMGVPAGLLVAWGLDRIASRSHCADARRLGR